MFKKQSIVKTCCFYRRNFIILLALQVFITSGCHKDVGTKEIINLAPTGLNVILILGDDVGYEILSCNGGQSYSTPNLDKMAQQGMRFTQCHGSPVCSPSRFMFLTGKYSYRNYIQSGVMSPSEKTIAGMFKGAGYATCVAGKWQLDGGDASIRSLGFDKYCVNEAFNNEDFERYKNPDIYENGGYLPKSITANKYSEDIFNNYVLDFIDSNLKEQKPFFIYYPMALCHHPFSPTPDDPEFATWKPHKNHSDTAFFPSMAKYMDKKIGVLIAKIHALGIEKNTVIIFIGDNGSPEGVTSIFNGKIIRGGKGTTTEYGTHVPLIAYCPGLIPAGLVNNDLISFPDFLPTVADIAGLKVPDNFGTIDGISFYSALKGAADNPRDWIFCHYISHENGLDFVSRWVQNKQYKLYDLGGNFYDIANDVLEENPIPHALLTLEELTYDASFQRILDSLK